MKKKSIGILGSGSWATALVKILSENTSKINWFIRNREIIDQIKAAKRNPKYLSSVDLNLNKGYGGGIFEGLKKATGDYIGWAHADLQTPLIDFFKLFLKIKDKKRIFGKGIRINNRGFDGIVSRFHDSLASIILGEKMREINAQPKIFDRDLLQYFSNMPHKWTTLDTYVFYICLKNNIQIETIDVVFNLRKYGQSKWKNNFTNFISHIFFNIIYLFKLRIFKKK